MCLLWLALPPPFLCMPLLAGAKSSFDRLRTMAINLNNPILAHGITQTVCSENPVFFFQMIRPKARRYICDE